MSLIEASGLCKTYQAGDIAVKAIKEVNFSIDVGSFVSFVGPSGSGKSTLLNMIGCLDSPSCGELHVAGTDVSSLSQKGADTMPATPQPVFPMNSLLFISFPPLWF